MPVTRNQWKSSRGPTEFESSPRNVEENSNGPAAHPLGSTGSKNDLRLVEAHKINLTTRAYEKNEKVPMPAKHQQHFHHHNHHHQQQTSSRQLITQANQQIQGGGESQQQQTRIPEKNFHILIAVTGSVATIKMIELISRLRSLFPQTFTSRTTTTDSMHEFKATISIRVVMTDHSKHFIKLDELEKLKAESNDLLTYTDLDEWDQWKEIGDPVLHVELRKWADLYLIAPLDANTMAKLANGICDNLVTCVARAWDTTKPLIYCPAMNTHMYNHPITRDQLCKLQSLGYLRVDSIEKRLACGDVGIGGMASVESIADKVVECLLKPQNTLTKPLAKPLLNAQPTYPIMSMNECVQVSPSKLPSAIQLLNRIKPNNHLTLSPLDLAQRQPASAAPAIPSTSSNLVTSNNRIGFVRQSSQIRPPSAAPTSLNLTVNKSHQQHNTNYPMNNSRNLNNGRPTIIPSLQNLKQIDSCYNQNDDFGDFGVDLDDDHASERFDYEIDPSKLLEQTLITEDNMGDDDSGSTQSLGFNQMTSSSDDGLMMQNEFITPVFNTSKFLMLCQNKSKGCYTCAICKKNYKNRKSMARHLKEQHVQGNIFHCTPCGVAYKRKEKLIKHIRERHEGATQQ